MSDRRYSIYITGDLLHSLAMIAGKRPVNEDNTRPTAESIAEEMIRAAIKEKYPQLLEHQKAVREMERELMKQL
jgi:hypothetical protein